MEVAEVDVDMEPPEPAKEVSEASRHEPLASPFVESVGERSQVAAWEKAPDEVDACCAERVDDDVGKRAAAVVQVEVEPGPRVELVPAKPPGNWEPHVAVVQGCQAVVAEKRSQKLSAFAGPASASFVAASPPRGASAAAR